MIVDYVNPFIIGAIEVFEEVASIELKKTDVVLKNNTASDADIAIIFGVSGYLTGQVVCSFKEHTAQRVVQSMMPNSTPQQQAEYLFSALSAMANMITGRATILLAGKNNVIYITPPMVKIHNQSPVEFMQGKTISVNFSSRFGSIEINVSLKPSGK
jgi:CheY-specific phosphatase CheX